MEAEVDGATAGAGGPSRVPAQRAGWVLAIVIVTTVMTGLSLSIMVVTFPAIAAAFPEASSAQLSWINNLFTIVSAATLIPCGVLADRVGRKRMVLVGAALFTVGCLVGALSPSPEWIMVGRTIQALGAAAFGPAGIALLIATFPPERLPTAIGLWAVTSGVAAAAGPSVGGFLIDWGGWQWAFWICLPLGLFAVLVGPFVLQESTRDPTRRLPDLVGVVLVMASTSVVTLGVVQPKTDPGWGWLGVWTLACFAVGGALLAWFIDRCRRRPNPLLRLDLFRVDDVRFGSLGLLASGVAFYSLSWAFVQHTVNEWDWTISKAGAATCPIALVSGVAAILSSRAATRRGQRPFIFVGSLGVIGTCGFLWFAMGDQEALGVVVVGASLLGLFSGLVFPAYIATTLLGVPADQHSVGSAINFMAQRTSATLGTSLAITFVAGASGSSGLRAAIVVCATGSAVGFGLGFLVRRPTAVAPAPPVLAR